MIVINSQDEQHFTLNGVQYFRNYVSETAGNLIRVYNCFTAFDIRIDFTNYSQFLINGESYGNVADTQEALNLVTFNKFGTAGGGITDAPIDGQTYGRKDAGWVEVTGGGGGGATNLEYTASEIDGFISSSTGTGATIPLATDTDAGLLKPTKFTVLENTSGTNTGDNATNSQYSGLEASKENTANKQNSLTVDGTGIKFPTVDAVNAGLADVNTNAIDRITVKLSQAINKGQAVYISSANGTNIIVSKASNTSEATSSKTLGLLETTGTTNAIVNVITDGLLAGIDTSTATIGDAVWLGTSGNLLFGLANKPVAPAHLVYIGVVSRVSATVGEIIIKVQNGFELNEIHDVLISSVANNQLLSYDSATSLWKNKSVTTADIADSTNKRYTTDAQQTILASSLVTGAGTTGQIAYFASNGSAISGLDATTYPSLTELAYIKGVTSSIQTQLDAKISAVSPTLTGLTTLTGTSQSGSSASGILSLTQTWNTTGSPTAIILNVTNTASGSASRLLDLQTGGVSRFAVDKLGGMSATLITSTAEINAGLANAFTWGTTNSRATIYSPSNGVIRLSNGTGTDFTRLQFGLTNNTAPSIKRNGTALNFRLADDSADCPITASNGTFSGNIIVNGTTSVVRLKGYTVATLPSGTQGDNAFVTDALAPTILNTVVGGGTVVVRVFYNGTNWIVQ